MDSTVRDCLVAAVCGGNVLLEGVPGLGKTLLVKSLSQALDLGFARIQFTPDLMPADITGTRIVSADDLGRKRFELHKGPIFHQIVLADEVNRANPKTQSVLEAMQERQVTIVGRPIRCPVPSLSWRRKTLWRWTVPTPARGPVRPLLLQAPVRFPNLEDMRSILFRTTGTEARTSRRSAMVRLSRPWARSSVKFL